VIRADLPTGIASAQIGHAAGESSPGNLPEGTYCIVLAARDEPELLVLESKLRAAGVGLRAIRESDPPYSGQLMALGLTPIPKSVGRRYLSCLPSYRGGAELKKAA
jgi:hypothetical protein